MLTGGDSPAGLIGPRLYREMALPLERHVIARLKSHASVPVSLHICGDATPLLADMAASGADVLELDHLVNVVTAGQVLSGLEIANPGDPLPRGPFDPGKFPPGS